MSEVSNRLLAEIEQEIGMLAGVYEIAGPVSEGDRKVLVRADPELTESQRDVVRGSCERRGLTAEFVDAEGPMNLHTQ